MCGVSEMVQRWQSVRDNLIILTGETMQEISKDIIGLVQDQLYEDGTDGNGEKLEEYREIAYSKLKFSMRGKSITDLYLTGAFQEAMILIIEGDSYTITSTDEKTKELEKKYGSAIMALTYDNKQMAFIYCEPLLTAKIKEITEC